MYHYFKLVFFLVSLFIFSSCKVEDAIDFRIRPADFAMNFNLNGKLYQVNTLNGDNLAIENKSSSFFDEDYYLIQGAFGEDEDEVAIRMNLWLHKDDFKIGRIPLTSKPSNEDTHMELIYLGNETFEETVDGYVEIDNIFYKDGIITGKFEFRTSPDYFKTYQPRINFEIRNGTFTYAFKKSKPWDILPLLD